VTLALEHGLDPPGHRGKQTALEQDREQQFLDWTKQTAESGTPVTRKEIKNYCTSQFQVPITRGWVNSFVLHCPDEFIQAKSFPQEG
jgi:transposase